MNTSTADDKYSLPNKDNFNAIISDAIISERKKISEFFSVFYEFRLNFEQFEKKDDLHSLCVLEITDRKRRA